MAEHQDAEKQVAAAKEEIAAAKEEIAAADAKVTAADAKVTAARDRVNAAIKLWSDCTEPELKGVLWDSISSARIDLASARTDLASAQRGLAAAQDFYDSCRSRLGALLDSKTKRRKVTVFKSPGQADSDTKTALDAISNIELGLDDLKPEAIKNFISQPLADVVQSARSVSGCKVQLKVSEHLFAQMMLSDECEATAYTAQDEAEEPSALSAAISALSCPSLVPGCGEAAMHGLVDAVLVPPLLFGLSMHMSRDRHPNCTDGCSRRDGFLSLPSGATVMQLEEKTEEAYKEGHAFHDPVEQLKQRTPWESWSLFFGMSPVALAVVVVGGARGPGSVLMTFGVLVRADRQFKTLCPPVDIFYAGGRIKAFNVVLRLLPHLRKCGQLANDAMPLDWKTPARLRGTTMVSLALHRGSKGVYVEKTWSGEFDARKIKQLEALYGALREADRTGQHFQRLVGKFSLKKRPPSVTACFDPFGFQYRMWTLREQGVQALRHVIEAVLILHRARIVHRDLRWPNVVQHPVTERFILIDFDDAVVLHGTKKAEPVKPEEFDELSHAPACFTGKHSFEVDVWSIGHMIEQLAEAVTNPVLATRLAACAAKVKHDYNTMKIVDVQPLFAEACS